MFTTDHQLELLIFRTTEDFTFGVNTLAIGTWGLLRLAQMLKTRYGIKGDLKAESVLQPIPGRHPGRTVSQP